MAQQRSRTAASRALAAALLLVVTAGPLFAGEVRFEINDAQVKGMPVAGARVLIATEEGGEAIALETGAEGVAEIELAAGVYRLSYLAPGYVPIRDSVTEIGAAPRVITTTMTRLLEAGPGGGRRVRLVLNWGSHPDDVRDVDGHAWCACGEAEPWVYYGAMSHEHLGHALTLDVDDVDWGGPETLTLSDPPPGVYGYRVHQFSHDLDALGASDVVVRVFFDDRLAAELPAPAAAGRHWRPFKELVVEADLSPRLVRFTADELAAGEHLEPPRPPLAEEAQGDELGNAAVGVVLALVTLALLVTVARRAWRRARS